MESLKNEFEDKKNKITDSLSEQKDKLEDAIDEKKEALEKSLDKGVANTKSFFKKVLKWTVLLVIVAAGLFLVYANWTYSDGTRAGDLIKISKKGYILKTYEGQLKLGGIDLTNQDEGLSDTWSFSVKDKAMYDKLEKLQGQEVVLRYKQINYAMPWQGDTEYYIYEIEE